MIWIFNDEIIFNRIGSIFENFVIRQVFFRNSIFVNNFFLNNFSFMRIYRKRFDVKRVFRFISKNQKIRYFLYLSIKSYENRVFSFFIIFFSSLRFFQKKNRLTFLNSRIEFFYFFVCLSYIFSICDLFVFMFLKYSRCFFKKAIFFFDSSTAVWNIRKMFKFFFHLLLKKKFFFLFYGFCTFFFNILNIFFKSELFFLSFIHRFFVFMFSDCVIFHWKKLNFSNVNCWKFLWNEQILKFVVNDEIIVFLFFQSRKLFFS